MNQPGPGNFTQHGKSHKNPPHAATDVKSAAQRSMGHEPNPKHLSQADYAPTPKSQDPISAMREDHHAHAGHLRHMEHAIGTRLHGHQPGNEHKAGAKPHKSSQADIKY